MADAICHLGEIVVSESDPTTSLWPGLFFFPLKVMQIVVDRAIETGDL